MERLTQVASALFFTALFGCAALAAQPSALVLSASLSSQESSTAESAFGDLVADAVLSAAHGADLALVPSAELKPDTIPAGKIPAERLVQDLRAHDDPADTVVTMRVSGAEVIAALTHAASREPSPFDGFLQVSGLHVAYSRDSSGNMVVAATLDATHSPLQPKASYTVAMPSYLADGAYGYFAVWPEGASPVDTGVGVAKAVGNYADAHQPIDYSVMDRITGA